MKASNSSCCTMVPTGLVGLVMKTSRVAGVMARSMPAKSCVMSGLFGTSV